MAALKGSTKFYDYSITDTLEHNLREMYSYGLIQRGAYTVVNLDSDYSVLQRVTDPRYTTGTVYEGLGPNWVWQSGVSVPNGHQEPFLVSGVYVNNVFYPVTTSGTYAHTVDYQTGRIIFDTAVSSSAVVKAEYVFSDVGVYLTSSPQWKTIITEYAEKYLIAGELNPSGIAAVLKQNRVWMPAMFIEVKDLSESRGLQLGGGEIQSFTINYHIFAEEPKTRNSLIDIINDQVQHTINIYNLNLAPHTFNTDGSLASGRKEYDFLANPSNGYFLSRGFVASNRGGAVRGAVDLFRGEIRSKLQVDRPPGTY